jgi:hypothetical protein
MIDFFFFYNIAAQNINPIKISLQEVYEYYLAQKEDSGVAV